MLGRLVSAGAGAGRKGSFSTSHVWQRFSSSASSADTGVWMKDLSGSDLSSLAVRGPNRKWQVVRDGGDCAQMDAKPADFEARICSVEDISPDPNKKYLHTFRGGFTATEAFYAILERNIHSHIGDSLGYEFWDEDCTLSNHVLPKICEYRDPTNKTLDKDARRLLSYIQNIFDERHESFNNRAVQELFDNADELFDADALFFPNFDLLKIPHLPGIKEADQKWMSEIAERLHDEGWEIRWDIKAFTAEDIVGGEPTLSGELYMSDGVWVPENHVFDETATPLLYLPCFPGKSIVESEWRSSTNTYYDL